MDLPVMFAVMLILTVPALLKGRLSRWQGVLMLCIYAAFCAAQFAMWSILYSKNPRRPAGVLRFIKFYCCAKSFTSSLSMKAAPAKPAASSWPSCLPSFLPCGRMVTL